jgi:hypothetical protein
METSLLTEHLLNLKKANEYHTGESYFMKGTTIHTETIVLQIGRRVKLQCQCKEAKTT